MTTRRLALAAAAFSIIFSATAQESVSITSVSPKDGKTATLPMLLYDQSGSGPIDGRWPAVVEAHGCGGRRINDDNWVRLLHRAGYVVLALDSFRGRGVSRTCETASVSHEQRLGDAYAALKFLQTLPNVDAYRVGIIGFSHGGGVALNAVAERSPTALLGNAPRYAASIAVYPDCLMLDVDSISPTLVLAGEADDWTPASLCAKKIAKRKAEGYPVDLRIYPNALHAWDDPATSYYYGANFANWNAKSGRGATVGYNAQARIASEQDALAFFEQHLKRAQIPASKIAWQSKPAPSRD